MVFQQYQDPTVNKYLNYGYWWQAHKEAVFKISTRILIGICIVFWSLAAYLSYGFFTTAGFDRLLAETAQSRSDVFALHEKFAPQPVRVLETSVIPVAAQEVDFLALVENPNPAWYAEVEYVFSWDNGQTLPAATFLLPGEKTVLYTAGATAASAPAAARAEVRPRAWQRVRDGRMLARMTEIMLALKFSEEKVISEDVATAVSYQAANNSIYNLAGAQFIVVLSQIGRPLAVGINSVDSWPAGAVLPLEYRWLKSFPSATAQIYPRVNLLSPESWKSPSGGEIQF